MSAIMVVCRLCGSSKHESDIISDLNDEEGENLSLRAYIQYYCRVEMKSGEGLSTKVCRVCRLHFETFVAFCDNLLKTEKNFSGTSQVPGIKAEPKTEEETASNVKKEPRDLFKNKTAMKNVSELFDESLNKTLEELESFSHITVDFDNVTDLGEISKDWLSAYGVATWHDFVYKCYHCREKFKSLSKFLCHMKEASVGKFQIKCTDCDKPFSAINSYINHVTKNHHEHLAFCCIECSKIHYNVAALIKHYHTEHPSINSIFPCIECAYYAQHFTQLRIHYFGHKTQEVSDSSDDETPSKTARNYSPKPTTSTAATTVKNNDGKIYHQKAFKGKRFNNSGPGYDPSLNRKVYPCDQCSRVLLTHQGWIYHKNVHDGTKPHSCDHCTSSFRSKQARDEHAKSCHSKA